MRVGVIGGGLMGSGIAEVCARSGVDVTVVEADDERAERSRAAIERSLDRGVRSGKLSEEDARRRARAPRVLDRVRGHRGRRRGDRGRDRGRARQARRLPAPRRAAARRAVPRLQHVFGADHEARRRDEAPRSRARAALLQPGAGAAAGRARALDHDRARDGRRRARVRRGHARQAVHRLPGPRRLRRQRAADPVSAVRDPHVRVRLRLQGGHRSGHGARAARTRWGRCAWRT